MTTFRRNQSFVLYGVISYIWSCGLCQPVTGIKWQENFYFTLSKGNFSEIAFSGCIWKRKAHNLTFSCVLLFYKGQNHWHCSLLVLQEKRGKIEEVAKTLYFAIFFFFLLTANNYLVTKIMETELESWKMPNCRSHSLCPTGSCRTLQAC